MCSGLVQGWTLCLCMFITLVLCYDMALIRDIIMIIHLILAKLLVKHGNIIFVMNG